MGWNHPYIFWGIAKTIHERPGASILEKMEIKNDKKWKIEKGHMVEMRQFILFFFKVAFHKFLNTLCQMTKYKITKNCFPNM